MRVKTHPDKVKKPGMSAEELKKIDERAAAVCEAADVLMDPYQKREYDSLWINKYGGNDLDDK